MWWKLLEPGEAIALWDEFFDTDEEMWMRVPQGRVGSQTRRGDVIRRSVGDIVPPVMSLLVHLEALRSLPVDEKWMAVTEQYVAEIKRRLGKPSIGRVNEDGTIEPTTMRKRPKSLKELFREDE